MEDAHSSMPPSARLVAYVDDCVLLVHPDEASAAWAALERELPAASLSIKASKSRLWLQQHHPCDAPPLSNIVAAHPDTRGLHLVGIRATSWEDTPLPLGMPAFVQEHLSDALPTNCKPDHEPVYQLLVYFARHLAVSLFTHHFRAVPIQATMVLAKAAQMVVEDMLSTVTGSMVMDWQVQLAFAPPHAGGLGILFLPTTACVARYAALWQLQQPDDAGSFASHFASKEAPVILGHFTAQHAFNLSRHIPDIRALPEVRARKHIQRKINFCFLIHQRFGLQADVQDRFVEGVEVGSVARHFAAFAHTHTQGPTDALRMVAAAWASALPTQPNLVICNSTLRFAVRRQL
eukprot:6481082-Amphidinium_carterae.1